MTIVHDPGGLGFRIETLWAFVAVSDDDDEGIAAFLLGSLWYPAVTADPKRLDAMRPQMQRIVDATGKRVKLVKFSGRTDVEVLGGAVEPS